MNTAKYFIIPHGYEIEDFSPIEIIEDDYCGRIAVTHYDGFNALHDTLLNFDFIGYDAVQMLKSLKEKTGIEPNENDIADNAELLKAIKEGNTDSTPEMRSDYVWKIIEQTKPKKFSDYVAINGFVNGRDVYEGNAKDLFADGVCDFSNFIAFREDILLYLDNKRKEYAEKTGKEVPLSYFDCFKISEYTRKGRAEKCLPEYEDVLKQTGVPDWYIESAKKIKYLFPKAHAVENMITAFKLLWYKLNCPDEFQEADYEVNGIIPTGLKKFDEILDGELRKGSLYLIASCHGYGKTSLAIQIAANFAESGKKVFFCSLELLKEQIKDRLAKQRKDNVSLITEDRSIISPCEIKELLITQNADIAIIDYLGLISIEGKFEKRSQEITEIIRQLKAIAKDLQIPIICLSQLSPRAMRIRGKGHIPRPKLPEDLRVFGSIEQYCDVIIFLHREEDATDSTVEIIVARNRYGECRTIEATFDKERLTFKEV